MIRSWLHPSGKRRRELFAGWLYIACMAGIGIYAYLWREDGGFQIPCMFRAFFGLYCPGCGLTRALHSLLHGDVHTALSMNTPMVFILPFAAYVVLEESISRIAGRSILPALPLPPGAVIATGALLLLYCILRNIPFFSFLAPAGL